MGVPQMIVLFGEPPPELTPRGVLDKIDRDRKAKGLPPLKRKPRAT